MKRQMRTLLVLILIATLPQPSTASARCTGSVLDPNTGEFLLGGCFGNCNPGAIVPFGGESGPGSSSPSLPANGQGTNVPGGSCSSCGPTSLSGNNTSSQGSLANQLYRIWMPTHKTEQSSFAPGMFSQFDNKLQISSGTGGYSISYLNAAREDSFYLVDGLDGDALDGIFHDQQKAIAREIKMLNASGTAVTDPAQATKFIVTHWSGAKEEFDLVDLDPTPTAVNYVGRLTKQIDLTGRETVITLQNVDSRRNQRVPITPMANQQRRRRLYESAYVHLRRNSALRTLVRWPDCPQRRSYGFVFVQQYGLNRRSVRRWQFSHLCVYAKHRQQHYRLDNHRCDELGIYWGLRTVKRLQW